ncbi:MAG: polynucleotide kinase-phosphatase, partial [Alphaproteobacteria bacterium]
AVYTRTGRPFFTAPAMESALLDRLRDALDRTGFWDRFQTDWACLDAEIMPWSAKAQALLVRQFAPVGAAARIGLSESVAALEAAVGRGVDAGAVLARFRARGDAAQAYAQAYRHYCWPVSSLDDLKVAPFHLLATEGSVHADKDHLWHMTALAEICRATDGPFMETAFRPVDLTDRDSVDDAVSWWVDLTDRGGEGIVVKPQGFVVRGKRGLVQPAIKCRGREYLRIIYGPEYTMPEHLGRLRRRGLGLKRSLAMREFALGLTALERFVGHQPLRQVHECVFAVLALESEPVDSRL